MKKSKWKWKRKKMKTNKLIECSDKCTLAMNELWEQNRNALLYITLEKDFDRFKSVIEYIPNLINDLEIFIKNWREVAFLYKGKK